MDGESPCIRHQLASKYMIGIGNFCTPGLCMLGQETSERYNYQTKGWWCGLCAARSVTFYSRRYSGRADFISARAVSASACYGQSGLRSDTHSAMALFFVICCMERSSSRWALLVYSDPKRLFKKSWDTRKLTKRW